MVAAAAAGPALAPTAASSRADCGGHGGEAGDAAAGPAASGWCCAGLALEDGRASATARRAAAAAGPVAEAGSGRGGGGGGGRGSRSSAHTLPPQPSTISARGWATEQRRLPRGTAAAASGGSCEGGAPVASLCAAAVVSPPVSESVASSPLPAARLTEAAATAGALVGAGPAPRPGHAGRSRRQAARRPNPGKAEWRGRATPTAGPHALRGLPERWRRAPA